MHRFPALSAAALALAIAAVLRAQSPVSAANDQVVTLTPFDVSAAANQGYRATNSVSGTRVNMSLMDIPQTVSVITADFMNDLGFDNLDQVLTYASSVSGGNYFFSGDYSVRGFNIGSPLRNGNPMANNGFNVVLDPAFLERVEVVKGPSSALYGIGSPGGVINLVTKQPEDKASTTVTAQADSLGGIRGVIDLTGPTGWSGLDYRVIAVAQKQYSTVGFGERESTEISPMLRWTLAGATSTPTVVTVTFDWLDMPKMISADERYPQLVALAPTPTAANPGATGLEAIGYVPGLPPRFSMDGPNAERNDSKQYFEVDVTHVFGPHVSGRATYSENYLQVSRTSQFVNGNITLNAAGQIPSVIPVDVWHVLDDGWAQQLRSDLDFTYEWPGTKANLILGAQYDRSTIHQVEWENLSHNSFNLFDPGPADWYLGNFPTDFTEFVNSFTVGESSLFNAVGSVSLLNDRLTAVGGFSRTYAIKSLSISEQFVGVPNGTALPVNQATPFAVFDEYQAGLTYKLFAGLSAFYDYSQSAQSNGYRFPDQPETGHGGEAGFRADLLHGRISGSISYFNEILSDIPESNPNLPLNPVILSGEQQSKGVEADLFIFPTDNWQIVLNYTNMRPTIISNTAAPYTQGNTIDGAYPREFNGFTKYTFAGGPLRHCYVSLGVNFRSETKPFGSVNSLYLLTNAPYVLWNPGIGYSWKAGRGLWRTSLMVNNAFDTAYMSHTAQPGEGRMAVAETSFTF